jgi:small-conductance mechanosensitive channel
MDGFLDKVIVEPFERFCEGILQYLPNVLSFILILISGIVLGTLLKIISLRLFRLIQLDRFSERAGMLEMLRKGGIKEPLSVLMSKIIGWLTLFAVIIIAMSALQVPEVERLLGNFFLYLPNIFIAAIILFFGYLLSNFLGRAALITSVNAGIPVSGIIGKLVKVGVFILAITMALEQLGIGKDTIIIAFAIVFGGIVLALAIAFGLGGKDAAKEYLDKKLRGEEKDDEIKHL